MNLYDAITMIDKNDKSIGGGAVSAAVASMSAIMVRMVAELSLGKDYGLEDSEYSKIVKEAENLALLLRNGALEDSVAYNKIVAAYRLPKNTEQEKMIRKNAVSDAGYYASKVPADNAIACNEVLKLTKKLNGKSNTNADSDLYCASIFLKDAIRGCIKNIEANLYLIKNENQVEELMNVIEILEYSQKQNK